METITKNRTMNATIWTAASIGSSSALRLAGNLILSRLLVPEQFGIMALISILMQGLAMFSDVGIGANIIRSRRGEDPDFLNTAWTVQVARGFVLWLCTCIIAIPFSEFYKEPALATYIPVVGLGVMIAGFSSTALFTENRNLNLRKVTEIEIASHAAGLALMIGWALISPSVWALIAGGILSATARTFLSHFRFRVFTNKFRWDRSAASELIIIGKWIFFSSILGFTSMQIDRMVLGKLVTLDLLGIYTVGFMWAQAPLLLAHGWISRVFFPIAAKVMSADTDNPSDFLHSYRKKILFLAAPIIGGIAVAMPKMIDVLYLPEFQAAGLIGLILTIGNWLTIQQSMYASICLAAGKSIYLSMSYVAQIIIFISIVFSLYDLWGVYGIAASAAISQFGLYVVCAFGVIRLGHFQGAVDLVTTGIMLSLAYVGYMAVEHLDKENISSIGILLIIGGISGSLSLLTITAPIFYKRRFRTN